MKEFADFLEAHGGRREAVTDAASTWGLRSRRGSKRTSPTPRSRSTNFTSSNSPTRPSTRCGARRRGTTSRSRADATFLKNVDRLTQEEKEALSRLEAQNLDTIQAMQISMNLQQLFTMSVKSAERFLDRWNAWVQVCDLAPMKKLAKTITAKSEGISDRSPPAFPMAFWRRSTATSRPPSARPRATEPNETSKPCLLMGECVVNLK